MLGVRSMLHEYKSNRAFSRRAPHDESYLVKISDNVADTGLDIEDLEFRQPLQLNADLEMVSTGSFLASSMKVAENYM